LAIAATACLAGLSGSQVPAASAADATAQSAQPLTGGEAMLQTIRKLVGGRWEAKLPDNRTIVDTFQPFNSGTYVLGEEWVDGKQITSTVFYMVGSQLWADHFCDYGNQPRYTAKPSGDPSIVDLQFRSATDLDTHARHFHSTKWHLIDATHMTQDWEVTGGPKGRVMVHLDFVRKGSTS
jgi:hypothetical protein